jgi:hypothetical protein
MQRTRIDDLELEGHELSEEHLRLASGGLPPGWCISLTHRSRWDIELDW